MLLVTARHSMAAENRVWPCRQAGQSHAYRFSPKHVSELLTSRKLSSAVMARPGGQCAHDRAANISSQQLSYGQHSKNMS